MSESFITNLTSILPTHAHDKNDKKNYFHVVLAGLQGGGNFLTGLRQHIGPKGFVASSLSTRFGLKQGEFGLKSHYTNLANQIIKQAQDKPIRIYAHSLGGIEVLDLMKVLAQHLDLPQRSLEVLFISPPGVGQQGWRVSYRLLLRLFKLIKTLGLHDQYQLLPLINKNEPENNPTENFSFKKRTIFLNEWLPRLVVDGPKCHQITKALQTIDSELLFLQNWPALEATYAQWYKSKRHKLMKKLMEGVLSGNHIAELTHTDYLKKYGEYSRYELASSLAQIRTSFEFILSIGKRLYQGVDTKIVEAFEACQQAGIDLKIGIVIMAQDALVSAQDYTTLLQLAHAKQIPISKHTFENQEHASVAYNWDLIDALEALVWGQESSQKI
jgi:hypothetical protein